MNNLVIPAYSNTRLKPTKKYINLIKEYGSGIINSGTNIIIIYKDESITTNNT